MSKKKSNSDAKLATLSKRTAGGFTGAGIGSVVGRPVDALQFNLLSEQENREILQMLASIQSYLGIANDHEAKFVEAPTEPAHIVQKIEEAMERSVTRPA
jgi:hypothetical protein